MTTQGKSHTPVTTVGNDKISPFTYEHICGVPVGTLKGRMSRAREKLAQLLALAAMEDIGRDRITRTVMPR
jgi:hypothetical protein